MKAKEILKLGDKISDTMDFVGFSIIIFVFVLFLLQSCGIVDVRGGLNEIAPPGEIKWLKNLQDEIR